MNKSQLSYRAFLISFTLSFVCISLVGLCGWFVSRLWENSLLQQLLCCLWPGQQGAMVGMSSGPNPLRILAGMILAVGLWTIVRQAWQTSRKTSELLAFAEANLPPSLSALVAELGLQSCVILVRAETPIAFCFGFWRPRICVSTELVELLSPKQLKAALLHEEYHRQRLDPLRILFIEAISAMFFFLPVMREWGTILQIKLELAADRYAIRQAGKAALAGALHRLLTHTPTAASPVSGAVTAGLGANAARIAELLGERTAPQRVSLQSLRRSTAVLLLICLLLML